MLVRGGLVSSNYVVTSGFRHAQIFAYTDMISRKTSCGSSSNGYK